MEAEKEKREQSKARKGGRNTGKRIERDLNRYKTTHCT